jgi:hypothetical protein
LRLKSTGKSGALHIFNTIIPVNPIANCADRTWQETLHEYIIAFVVFDQKNIKFGTILPHQLNTDLPLL